MIGILQHLFLTLSLLFMGVVSHISYYPISHSTQIKQSQVLSETTSSGMINTKETPTPLITTPTGAPLIVTPKEKLIDCIGPDGKHLEEKVTQKQCDDFNNAWKKPTQNDNSSSNANNQGSQNTNNPEPKISNSQQQTISPVPTNSNTPFDASWVVNKTNEGNSVFITADKPLKSCSATFWGGGSISVTANSPVSSGNTCSIGPSSSSPANTKVYASATSIYGETKEFGEKPPCTSSGC